MDLLALLERRRRLRNVNLTAAGAHPASRHVNLSWVLELFNIQCRTSRRLNRHIPSHSGSCAHRPPDGYSCGAIWGGKERISTWRTGAWLEVVVCGNGASAPIMVLRKCATYSNLRVTPFAVEAHGRSSNRLIHCSCTQTYNHKHTHKSANSHVGRSQTGVLLLFLVPQHQRCKRSRCQHRQHTRRAPLPFPKLIGGEGSVASSAIRLERWQRRQW